MNASRQSKITTILVRSWANSLKRYRSGGSESFTESCFVGLHSEVDHQKYKVLSDDHTPLIVFILRVLMRPGRVACIKKSPKQPTCVYSSLPRNTWTTCVRGPSKLREKPGGENCGNTSQ